MRIGHVEVFGPDTEALRRFYVDGLGFEVEAEQPGGFVWLKMGGQEVLLRPAPARSAVPEYRDSRVAMVFYVADLAAATARIESAGPSARGTDGSDDCLAFADPAGNWFQVVEHD